MANDLGFGVALQLEDQFSSTATQVGRSVDSLEEKFTRLGAKTFLFNQMGEAVRHLQQGLSLIEGPGKVFEHSLAEVSAITGVVGDGLEIIGDKALAINAKFGTGAEGNLTMFKTILSRLGPDIAQTPEALDSMAQSINTLSKTMGGDVVAATDSLTTSINIYSSDITDALEKSKAMADQMNVIAAAAQVGSAEVPQISDSIRVAGLAAKAAGLEFTELNTLIQIMGRGSVYGAEAGTALRNVLSIMSQGRYMPRQAREGLIAAGVDIEMLGDATIPVKDRLIELSKIQGDSALLTEAFGRENSNAARVLLSNLSTYDQWKEGITGTNSANEQASIIMDTYSEKMGRLKARLENIAIGLFDATKEAMPFAQGLLSILLTITTLAPAVATLKMTYQGLMATEILSSFASFGFAGALEYLALRFVEVAAAAWAALLPMLPWIAGGLAIAAVIWGIAEAMDYFKTSLSGAGQAETGFMGLVQRIGGFFTALFEIFFGGITADTAAMLDKIGLTNLMFKIEGWVKRFGYVWDGIVIVLSDAWDLFKEFSAWLYDKFTGAFDVVADVLLAFGVDIKSSAIDVQSWVNVGKVLGYVLLFTILPPVIGLAVAFAAMAASIILLLSPFIALGYVIYQVYQLFTHWGEAMDWVGNKWDEFINWIGSGAAAIGAWFQNLWDGAVYLGQSIVNGIIDGVVSAWDSLVSLITGLIAELPGGEALLSFFGVETAGSGNARAIQRPIPNVAEAVADRTAVSQTPGRDTERITERSTIENITLQNIMDSEVLTEKVIEKQEFKQSRKNS